MFACTILTLFPEMFPGPLGQSLAGEALARALWSLETRDIREHGLGRHRAVDDTPAGGGPGMVMRADVLAASLDAALARGDPRPRIIMSPRGRPFRQALAREWAAGPGLVILCPRFEGVDERIIEGRGLIELSIGDYVLSGGDVAALAVLDVCVRLIPGVMGKSEVRRLRELRKWPARISAIYTSARVGGARDPRGDAVGRPRQDRRVATRRGPSHHARAPARSQPMKRSPLDLFAPFIPDRSRRDRSGRSTRQVNCPETVRDAGERSRPSIRPATAPRSTVLRP